MATKANRVRLEPAERRRLARMRLAYVGICAGMERRPHWSYDNAARGEPRGRFPWEALQEAVFIAIANGAQWTHVDAFYEELKAEARARCAQQQPEGDNAGCLESAVRESGEAVSAAVRAHIDGSESAIDRAIVECREAMHAIERYVRSLFHRREQLLPQRAGLRAL